VEVGFNFIVLHWQIYSTADELKQEITDTDMQPSSKSSDLCMGNTERCKITDSL